MANDKADGKPQGWTADDKKRGASGHAGGGGHPGEAADAASKASPTDDRAQMEKAAAETQKQNGEGQPS
jgi:hypothetical protein